MNTALARLRHATFRVVATTPRGGYVWVVYVAFVFLEPFLARSGTMAMVGALASVIVFLPLYFGMFDGPATGNGSRARLARSRDERRTPFTCVPLSRLTEATGRAAGSDDS